MEDKKFELTDEIMNDELNKYLAMPTTSKRMFFARIKRDSIYQAIKNSLLNTYRKLRRSSAEIKILIDEKNCIFYDYKIKLYAICVDGNISSELFHTMEEALLSWIGRKNNDSNYGHYAYKMLGKKE